MQFYQSHKKTFYDFGSTRHYFLSNLAVRFRATTNRIHNILGSSFTEVWKYLSFFHLSNPRLGQTHYNLLLTPSHFAILPTLRNDDVDRNP